MKNSCFKWMVWGACALVSLAFLSAEEGGAGHYVPGSMATLIDQPPTKPGWVVETIFLHYEGEAEVERTLPFAGLLAAGIEAEGDAYNGEPENRDYPNDMVLPNGKIFREQYGPRGVLHCKADGNGGQSIENLGPLTKKRMETIDDESVAAAKDFITRQAKAGEPFFCWWNGTRMHFRTHVKPEHKNLAGPNSDEYSDGMVEHDLHVGELLKLIDDLGLADNTIVQYSTGNGPHYNTWPDAGTTPFRGEKNSNWEGAFRVPCFIKWPGHFPAGVTLNGIVSHEDWLPTFAAAAGAPDIKEMLLKGGVELNGRTYKNHIDGYNQLDYLSGKVKPGDWSLDSLEKQIKEMTTAGE